MARFQTGIKELNSITGGLPSPSVILIEGDPGSGKQLFALQCIATPGDRVVVLTNNYPKEVQASLSRMGIRLEAEYIDCYTWLAGGESAVDSLGNLSQLLSVVEDSVPKGSLVVLDSLTPLDMYNNFEAVERFLQELVAITKAKECVLFITLDSGAYHEDAENTFESLVDGVFLLDKAKGLRIQKLRDTKTMDKEYYYEITDSGIKMRGRVMGSPKRPVFVPPKEEPKVEPKAEEPKVELKAEEPVKAEPVAKKPKKEEKPEKEEKEPEKKGPTPEEAPMPDSGHGGTEDPEIV